MNEKIPSIKSITPESITPSPIIGGEKLDDKYLQSIFTALDANGNGKLEKEEFASYDFGTDNLSYEEFAKKLELAEEILPRNNKEKSPPIEFKQDPKTGEISIKEIQDESFVPHSDISKGRIWAHSSSIKDLDFTKDPTILDKLKFSDMTFKNCKFPQDYNLQTVLENGKNPGLNIDKIHEFTTGKNVHVIVLDNPLISHEDIDKNIVSRYDTPLSKYLSKGHQHGTSVTSILTQVAPDVKVHSLGSPDCGPRVLKAEEPRMFKKALDLINSLPENQRPKVISLSAPVYNEKSQALIDKIQEKGCWVLSCDEFDKYFGYLDKIDPAGEPNNFENHQVASVYSPDKLYVNSGDRTLPSSLDTAGYRHDSQASKSWAVPVISGLYAAAVELKPDITPEKFIEIANKTAYKKEITDGKEKIASDIIWDNCLKRLCNERYPELTMQQICEDRTKKEEIEKAVDEYMISSEAKEEIQKEMKEPKFIKIIDAEKLMNAIKSNQ